MVLAQQSAGGVYVRGVQAVNPLWSFVPVFGGVAIGMVFGLVMNTPIDHMPLNVILLGICIIFGSVIYGVYNGGTRGQARVCGAGKMPSIMRAQQSAGELHLRGVSAVNPLWPLLSMVGGFGIVIVGLTLNSPIDHMSTSVTLLGMCVAFGSPIYGMYNAAREKNRDMAEMATCPVWCARNSPPEECTCGGCGP